MAVPGVLRIPLLSSLRSRWWALIPALSIIGFVFLVRGAEQSAQGLTYLALVAVPLLAIFALAFMVQGARPILALLVPPLFAIAWVDPGGLPGEAAGILLSALSCVALAVLIATVTPPRWLAWGIIAMAVADTVLVVSNLLQGPNEALNGVQPVAHLPALQDATFGSALMGYGDLFVAALLGALLATRSRSFQRRGALLAAALASAFDLLFFFVSLLPATVPMALTVILIYGWGLLRAPRILPTRTPARPRRAPALPAPSRLPEAGPSGK